MRPKVFFKATIWRLFLEGISENHLKSFVLIFGFIVGTYNNLKDFIEQLKITSSIKNWFNLDYKSFMGLILFNVSLVLVLILLSFLFSLIRTFIQNFDLTVIRKNEGLEISKGLLNKLNLELKASRIQNTTISTNRFKSALGLYQLAFTQAMVNKKQRQKFNIIGLSRVQINELLDQFYPMALIDIVKHKPNIYYVQRIWYISILPIISLNFAFYFISVSFILINIPLILLIGLATHYSFKKKYYSIDGNNIVIGGGGLIDTYTSLLEISKIQSITLSQTIFQKRRGLASLKIYSASRPLVIPHIEIFQAQNIKNYLLFKVESENKDWM